MGVNLATCPVCRCVVDGQEEHAKAWHEPIARALAYTAATGEPVETPGGPAWGGPGVAQPPAAPTRDEAALAATIRDRARELSNAAAEILPALEDYLTATATQAPTTAQAIAQVRVLTRAARGVILTTRDLVRLAARALEGP